MATPTALIAIREIGLLLSSQSNHFSCNRSDRIKTAGGLPTRGHPAIGKCTMYTFPRFYKLFGESAMRRMENSAEGHLARVRSAEFYAIDSV